MHDTQSEPSWFEGLQIRIHKVQIQHCMQRLHMQDAYFTKKIVELLASFLAISFLSLLICFQEISKTAASGRSLVNQMLGLGHRFPSSFVLASPLIALRTVGEIAGSDHLDHCLPSVGAAASSGRENATYGFFFSTTRFCSIASTGATFTTTFFFGSTGFGSWAWALAS